MFTKRLFAALIVCVVLVISTQALAWDGERRGFILGFGVGPGLCTFTQTVEYAGMSVTSERENKFGLNTDFKIGYALDNLLQIYWMSKVSWFGLDNVLGQTVTIANGVGGVGVTYYFNPTAPSPFVSGGIGFSSWSTPFESGTEAWYGFGLSGGAGYEFSRHWSVEGNLTWGKPSKEESGVKASSNALSVKITVNALGY